VSQEPPIPPTDLATREPLIVSVATGTTLHRFYRAQLAPIFFDEGRGGRLNSPNGAYRVLYTAETSKGAFAETFLRVPGRTQIGVDQIKERAYAQLHAGGELRLVKLYGNGLARLGATAEVTHAGLPYDLPQSWSAALFAHPVKADGIAYRACHDDDEVCHAIFDRAADRIEESTRELDLDQDWFYELMQHYNIGLAPE
jgi:hypothetical protein